MKFILVCGARPNFMKVAPIIRAIRQSPAAIQHLLVHTGQHYDYEMSRVFFEDLELPQPDIYLGVGSGTHAEQIGKVMIEFEKVLTQDKPDLVIVVGDVNSTLAAALASTKLCISVAHVEAGLRSFDRTMPEEINRVLTDAVSDFLFTHSPDANENLKKEGIAGEKIFLVGNVMIDSLLYNKPKAERSQVLSQLSLRDREYALLTLHRPNNVDEKENLLKIVQALRRISEKVTVVFPVHPRTRKNLENFGFARFMENRRILLLEPLGYIDFLRLMMSARLVVTDSGGIQEETTALDIPCLTLRNNTERPITVTQGTNTVVGNDTEKIVAETLKILEGKGKSGSCPALWDGKAAERIVNTLAARGLP